MFKLICKNCSKFFIRKFKRKYCSHLCFLKSPTNTIRKRGDNNVMKRQEVRQKVSKSLKGKFAGEKHPLWGKKHSLKARQKMSKSHTGIKLSEYHRKRQSGRKGEKTWNWKGNKVGYNALHSWVSRELGKPNKCENCGKSGLKARRIHWANKSREYKRHPSDWIRLCVSCHKLYDLSC